MTILGKSRRTGLSALKGQMNTDAVISEVMLEVSNNNPQRRNGVFPVIGIAREA
jgi:hypothetical protein